MKRKKSSYSLLYHLKVISLLILFAGLPLAVGAGIYQQTNTNSHAQYSQAMPNDILPRISPPAGCYYVTDYRKCPLTGHITIPCRAGENCTCPQILVCPSTTPPYVSVNPQPSISAQPTCITRPPCLDATPRCLLAEPNDGWCLPTITPPIASITPPPGCYFGACPIMCARNNPNCCKDFHRIICPSGSPVIAQPHCFPRPVCLDGNPPCKLPEPAIKWCPPANGTAVSLAPVQQNQNLFLIFLNTVLRGLTGK